MSNLQKKLKENEIAISISTKADYDFIVDYFQLQPTHGFYLIYDTEDECYYLTTKAFVLYTDLVDSSLLVRELKGVNR